MIEINKFWLTIGIIAIFVLIIGIVLCVVYAKRANDPNLSDSDQRKAGIYVIISVPLMIFGSIFVIGSTYFIVHDYRELKLLNGTKSVNTNYTSLISNK